MAMEQKVAIYGSGHTRMRVGVCRSAGKRRKRKSVFRMTDPQSLYFQLIITVRAQTFEVLCIIFSN